MHPLIEKSLSFPLAAKLLFLVSVGALLFALTMQFGFGVRPCILCIWARVPYGLAAVLAALALASGKPSRKYASVFLGLCTFVFLAGMGIAIFHSGIERHWWLGTSGCTALPLEGTSPEELRKALLQQTEPRCDEIPWAILGLSLANLNIAASLALAFFAAVVTLRHSRSK
jgi:disulfide bond formation protein DsbB